MIFVVSGPSGSGKTTLLDTLLKDAQLKKTLVKSVSFTTRPMRSAEKDKRDYFFLSRDEFKRRLKSKKILEWTRYLGYYYGTPKEFVDSFLAKGRHILLCLDFKGACQIKKLYPKNTVTIFIKPPSIDALKLRIAGRCSRTKEEEVKKRLDLARQELLLAKEYDYFVRNIALEKAANSLRRIVLKESNSRKG
ncbi:MAG: guanylate kinase [Candidatus Omnitrophica bacterium]|nr:guanylate kinase [Candidatus Omnitrophota bacterium]